MKIVWSRRALRHLTRIRDYIEKEVAMRIVTGVEGLARQPHIGRPGRIVSDTPYIVPYRVRGERLELLAIYHGRRKWQTN